MSTLKVSGIQIPSGQSGGITNVDGVTTYMGWDSSGNITFPQTLTAVGALVTQRIHEPITLSSGFPTGTVPFYVLTQTLYYYTGTNTGNWTFNIRGNVSTTLDSLLTTGQSITITIMVTNTGTGYWPATFQIDGSTRTVKWQGGTTPTSGNANSVDAWTYSIIKTASNTFTVFGSQTKFV